MLGRAGAMLLLLTIGAAAAPEGDKPGDAAPAGGPAPATGAVRAASAGPDKIHRIEEAFAPGFQDLSLVTVHKKVNVDELTKIGRDYANAYRISRTTVRMKEPGKFRMDARVGFIGFEYVMNGARKVIRAPLTKQYDDIGTDPGKRLGPLEAGLITPGALVGYDPGEHLACFVEDGRRVCQYRIRYTNDKERYELLWVDAERKYVKKRQFYTLIFGKYRMELVFSEPKEVHGLWIPTRVEVRNADGKLAGVTEQKDLKLNTGLSDDLFKL